MSDVNERLMEAAKAGAEIELKALLQESGRDALDKDDDGKTMMAKRRCDMPPCAGKPAARSFCFQQAMRWPRISWASAHLDVQRSTTFPFRNLAFHAKSLRIPGERSGAAPVACAAASTVPRRRPTTHGS